MVGLRRFLDPEEWKRMRTPPEIPPQDRPAGLPEFLQSQEPKKAKVPAPEETLEDYFLRGFLERASAMGEVPKPEIFEERFRKSVSPAREFLSNIFFGMAAGTRGEEFRSLRQRKYEEWLNEQKMRQEAERARQNYILGVANIAEQIQRARREEAMRRELAEIQRIEKAEDRQMRFAEFAARYNLDLARFKETQEYHNRLLKRPRDPYFDFGLQEAAAHLRNAGLDPSDPKLEPVLLEKAAEIGNGLYAQRQKIQMQFTPVQPRYESIKATNPWGEIEFGTYDKGSGRIVHGPEWWENLPRDTSPEQIRRYEMMDNSIAAMRRAVGIVASNPKDAVGGMLKSVPPEIRSVVMSVPSSERSARVFFNAAISQYILGMSGVATSGREEQRLTNGLPKFFEKPSNFVPGAIAFINMLEAAKLRAQAGIDPSDLDIGPVFDAYLNALQKQLEKGHYRFRVPTAQEMLEQAAKEKGYTFIRDAKGRIRGLRRPNAG